MSGMFSGCDDCCDENRCKAIQLYSRNPQYGFNQPDLIGTQYGEGTYSTAGGETEWEAVWDANKLISSAVLLGCASYYLSTVGPPRRPYFPPNNAYLPQFTGKNVWTTMRHEVTRVFKGGETPATDTCWIEMTVDPVTGLCTHLVAHYEDDYTEGTGIEFDCEFSLSLITGALSEPESVLALELAIGIIGSTITNCMTFVASGTDTLSWQISDGADPGDPGAFADGEYAIVSESLDQTLTWSGSGFIENWTAVEGSTAGSLNTFGLSGSVPLATTDGIFGIGAVYNDVFRVASSIAWQSRLRIMRTTELSRLTYRGDAYVDLVIGNTGSGNTLAVFPDRPVLVLDSSVWHKDNTITEENEDWLILGQGINPVVGPPESGAHPETDVQADFNTSNDDRNYFGLFHEVSPGEEGKHYIWGAKCTVQVQSDTLICHEEQPDLDVAEWLRTGSFLCDCDAMAAGRYTFNHDDALYSYGLSVIQRRTYYQDFASACYTYTSEEWTWGASITICECT